MSAGTDADPERGRQRLLDAREDLEDLAQSDNPAAEVAAELLALIEDGDSNDVQMSDV